LKSFFKNLRFMHGFDRKSPYDKKTIRRWYLRVNRNYIEREERELTHIKCNRRPKEEMVKKVTLRHITGNPKETLQHDHKIKKRISSGYQVTLSPCQ
jgi:hypothetical protein